MAKVWIGPSIVQKAKMRYGWGFNLLKMLKSGTAGVLYSLESEDAKKIKYILNQQD